MSDLDWLGSLAEATVRIGAVTATVLLCLRVLQRTTAEVTGRYRDLSTDARADARSLRDMITDLEGRLEGCNAALLALRRERATWITERAQLLVEITDLRHHAERMLATDAQSDGDETDDPA